MNKKSGSSLTNRRGLLSGILRYICIAVLAYVTGLLTLKYFRRGGSTCRSYTKCASCRIRDNCSLAPSLNPPKWRVAEGKAKDRMQ